MPLDPSADLTLHYAPRTRSLTAVWALEELGIPYALPVHDLGKGTHKAPDHLARNPMGKVPVLVQGDTVISETGALITWLGDHHASGTLAPAVESPDRGAYLRWMFFSGSVMEPAFGEVFFRWEVPSRSVAWGSFADMLRTLQTAIQPGPWLLGERFSLADVVVGGTARFGVAFGAIEAEGAVGSFVARLAQRPALQRAMAVEAAHPPDAG